MKFRWSSFERLRLNVNLTESKHGRRPPRGRGPGGEGRAGRSIGGGAGRGLGESGRRSGHAHIQNGARTRTKAAGRAPRFPPSTFRRRHLFCYDCESVRLRNRLTWTGRKRTRRRRRARSARVNDTSRVSARARRGARRGRRPDRCRGRDRARNADALNTYLPSPGGERPSVDDGLAAGGRMQAQVLRHGSAVRWDACRCAWRGSASSGSVARRAVPGPGPNTRTRALPTPERPPYAPSRQPPAAPPRTARRAPHPNTTRARRNADLHGQLGHK